ncbi:hypothetical protein NZD89_28525 (plasmid) [Alicyclobacillus fastidiosus]|uniref:Lipoprotein n=1 Tax=Alicyclobacillus fastidiosus TaxID=392011 RepID=A0ABY6ZP88_9BACL|nr:hypothetical protein [Alicyclobacillus fastidiosus]WAH44805.1 hypothetical protein NZD89_28525 [Alicyclobacillus fastidiosus]GMA65764.1 hypothetical protein GCM10025859_62040 [Alicyclobacillus fastidiosus]GMA65937.1 hypothetical protein GCM10025859_63780 [Alicyclobacillus fastidiosus]
MENKAFLSGIIGLSILALVGCGNTNNIAGVPTNTTTGTNTAAPTAFNTTGAGTARGITGDTHIIHLVSPVSNQNVKTSSGITVSGTVAKGFENQWLRVTLISETQSGAKTESKIFQSQKFKVDNNDKFSELFTIPDTVQSSGAKRLVLELLVKGHPQIQTTVKVHQQ